MNSVGMKCPILFTGGGYIGDVWENEQEFVEEVLDSFSENPIIFFPQTIFFRNVNNLQRFVDRLSAHKEIIFCARENNTYTLLREKNIEGMKVLLVPDMVLNMSENSDILRSNEAILCFRNDSEKVFENNDIEAIKKYLKKRNVGWKEYSTAKAKYVSLEGRDQCYKEAIKCFQRAKFVITDRLHGLILATITGTPVLFFDNLSKKISSTYSWIRNCDYVVDGDSYCDIGRAIDALMLCDSGIYKNEKYQSYYLAMLCEIQQVIGKDE